MNAKKLNLDRHLQDIFGFISFNPYQEEIIKTVLDKKDCLAVLPTGSGKSLCYQLPAIISKGLAIVISPLISLMKDQVMQINELGPYAVLLNSTLSQKKYAKNLSRIKEGKANLLYVAPETLVKENLLGLLDTIPLCLFTVDEAHCISEWGHDFRPEYRKLFMIRNRFKNVPCLALTATATSRVRQDIKASLGLKNGETFVASFDRPNLFLEVKEKDNPFTQLQIFLEQFDDQSGIIYCFSRKQTDHLNQRLGDLGFSIRPYHAGLTDKTREENQQLFIKDDVKIIVATVAFGMGINKPDVRFVVHYDLPKNIESYYQEIGRAGRDGLPAHCMLLLGYGDIGKIQYLIDQKFTADERRIAKIHLSTMVQYAESRSCRRLPLLSYFEEIITTENCKTCDNCLSGKDLEAKDLTIEAQMFMSCIIRTGELFGMAHIVDVLRGSKAKKVMDNNHHTLSTYNIGNKCSKKAWQQLGRQLIQQGVIIQETQYGSLKLTPDSWRILKSEVIFMGHMDIKDRSKSKTKEKYNYDNDDYDRVLFHKLKEKRKEIADAINMPPYIVFPDKSLIQMSDIKPSTLLEMKGIHGVGEKKFSTYAEAFFNIIKSYCDDVSP
ncbi:MAG: DNA helicase RecQ [Desulfobacula sp.]|jgi:ATP-dependent DNA helicase RecQ|nr:DNA helicase RecQ [Desulfobacula sp.]